MRGDLYSTMSRCFLSLSLSHIQSSITHVSPLHCSFFRSILFRSEMRRIKERGEKGRRGGGKSRFEESVSRAGGMLCKAFRALPCVRFDEKVYASHIARKKRI